MPWVNSFRLLPTLVSCKPEQVEIRRMCSFFFHEEKNEGVSISHSKRVIVGRGTLLIDAGVGVAAHGTVIWIAVVVASLIILSQRYPKLRLESQRKEVLYQSAMASQWRGVAVFAMFFAVLLSLLLLGTGAFDPDSGKIRVVTEEELAR